MIVIEDTDLVQGDATTAAEVDFTIYGLDNNALKQIADGQLANSKGTLYTANSTDVITAIILVNTGAAHNHVNLYLAPAAGTSRRLIPKDTVLEPGYSLIFDGSKMAVYGITGGLVASITTHATTHENGGEDEISVTGLSGLLADDQHVLDTEVQAIKIDDMTAGDDNADLDTSTTRHGLAPKAVAPAAGLLNVLGIANTEVAITNKAIFDATTPSDSDAVSAGSAGTAVTAARRDHNHKIDAAIADDAVLTVDDASAADDEFARFTATGIEGISVAAAITALLAAALPENTAIILAPALSADGKYTGLCMAGIAGVALAFGELCYLAVADSRWEKAKANVAATSFGKLGICVLAAAGDGSATTMLLLGNVRADAAFPALTIGAPVFISAATAGVITSTAPTGTTNFVVRIIGYGNTADELHFCPDNTYVELA